jgi:hypothetical protein
VDFLHRCFRRQSRQKKIFVLFFTSRKKKLLAASAMSNATLNNANVFGQLCGFLPTPLVLLILEYSWAPSDDETTQLLLHIYDTLPGRRVCFLHNSLYFRTVADYIEAKITAFFANRGQRLEKWADHESELWGKASETD